MQVSSLCDWKRIKSIVETFKKICTIKYIDGLQNSTSSGVSFLISLCFIDRFLHLAIIFGEDEFATQTIQMAKCKKSLSIHNNLQQSPLHLAVLTNKPCLVQLLLARGAVVDARDRHGNTPLHMACRCVCNFGCYIASAVSLS